MEFEDPGGPSSPASKENEKFLVSKTIKQRRASDDDVEEEYEKGRQPRRLFWPTGRWHY